MAEAETRLSFFRKAVSGYGLDAVPRKSLQGRTKSPLASQRWRLSELRFDVGKLIRAQLTSPSRLQKPYLVEFKELGVTCIRLLKAHSLSPIESKLRICPGSITGFFTKLRESVEYPRLSFCIVVLKCRLFFLTRWLYPPQPLKV